MPTQTYGMILTVAGAAKIAAALSGGPTVQLQTMAVGDAGGTAYTPTGTETALKHQTASVSIQSVSPDPNNPPWARVTGVLPASVGGFWIREIGVFDTTGTLIAIGNYPDTYKPLITEGASFDAPITVILQVGSASAVSITLNPSSVLATQLWVLSNANYFAVKSATTTTPPSAPAIGDEYLVPLSGATGAWSGQAGMIALWTTSGWVFINASIGATARTADTELYWVRNAAGWRSVMATNAEAAAGLSGTLLISPATLAAVVNHKASEDRLAFFGSF